MATPDIIGRFYKKKVPLPSSLRPQWQWLGLTVAYCSLQSAVAVRSEMKTAFAAQSKRIFKVSLRGY